MKRADVATVLARHGIDPAADEMTLTATLEACGWVALVEEVGTSLGAGRRRYQARATRPRPPGAAAVQGHPADLFPDHLSARGRTAAEALALVLATVLERRP